MNIFILIGIAITLTGVLSAMLVLSLWVADKLEAARRQRKAATTSFGRVLEGMIERQPK